MEEKLDEILSKLDRLLDPESGVYARVAEVREDLKQHKQSDTLKHRGIYIAIVVALISAAAGPGLAKALLEALG